MRPVQTILAAIAFLAAPALVAPAFAQTAQSGTVIVVDGERILTQSAAGRDLQQRLQAITTQIQGELTPEQTALQTEQQALQTATQGQTQQQVQANTQLRTRIEAFNRRAETFRQRQMTAGRDLEYTRQQALIEFNRQITPILNEVMTARGASVVLDTNVASRMTANVDATADVLSRLDQRVRTVNVTRQAAPAQPQQPQTNR